MESLLHNTEKFKKIGFIVKKKKKKKYIVLKEVQLYKLQ